jgi:DinB superfamily
VDRCTECGFSYELADAELAGPAIVEGAEEFAGVLRGSDPRITVRASATVWSGLEYGCHLRDVLLVQRERVLLARRSPHPAAEPMGRDERVDHDGYADQAPTDVARQLADAARLFAHVLTRLDTPDWERAIVYNYPEPADRTLRWLACHTLHEVRHHLLDAHRQLR